jgi:hypothetical protein
MDNSTPNENDVLVRYLDNELSPEEKAEMERKINSDDRLRSQYEDLRIAREAVMQYGIRTQVAGIHDSMMKELKVPVRRISSPRRVIRYGMSIAAGIILIVGAYMVYNFFTLSADGFYLSHYRSYDVGTTRSSGSSEKAINAYREKKYNEVVGIYLSGDSSSTTAFLAAMSNLQLNDVPASITLLEKLAAPSTATGQAFSEEAEYYLALAYIKNRDFDLAIPIMEKIYANPSHLYHEKISKKMIRQVKMLKWR